MRTRLDYALHLLEQAVDGETIRGLVLQDGVEVPLVRCSCSALLAVGPTEGPTTYQCHGCSAEVHITA